MPWEARASNSKHTFQYSRALLSTNQRQQFGRIWARFTHMLSAFGHEYQESKITNTPNIWRQCPIDTTTKTDLGTRGTCSCICWMAIAVNGTLEDRFLESESQHTTLANLKFAILVLASKCTIVLAISTVIRSILYFQPFHTENRVSISLRLDGGINHGKHRGLLCDATCFEPLWDTMVQLIRYVRNRHRQARSRSPSLQSTVQNT